MNNSNKKTNIENKRRKRRLKLRRDTGPGDASIVEHVHEEVVEVAVDDIGAGDVLRR